MCGNFCPPSVFMITDCVPYDSGPVGLYVRWYIMKDAGCMSYDSGPVGIYVMCTVIIYRIFEMIGWRSKIGWSDWLKLIREFIFTRTLGDSNLDSSNWFYALLGLFESPYRGLYGVFAVETRETTKKFFFELTLNLDLF
jgi:hypothetical protein